MSSATMTEILSGQPCVAVFGSGEARPGEQLYEDARQAGARLATAGLAVINGGYGGVMEAASRGATEAAGVAIGVTVRQFADRNGPNSWLSHEINEPDLYVRTRTLVESASGYLVLPGKAGTLAEISFLWALRRAGLLGRRPVVLAGPAWIELLETLKGIMLDPSTLTGTWVMPDTDAAVTLLLEKLG